MKRCPRITEKLPAPSHLTVSFLALLLTIWPLGALAANFAGSLQQVTITDAAGSNKPPKAVFTMAQSGNSVTLDASGSTDADGTISEYRWDFGDSTTGTGVKTTHQYQSFGTFPITLSVIDNAGGVALSQTTLVGAKAAAYFKLATAGTGANSGKIYDEISATWLGTGAAATNFVTEENRPCLKSTGPTTRVGIPVGNLLPNGLAKFTLTFNVKTADATLWGQSPIFFAGGGNESIFTLYDNTALHPTISERTNYQTVSAAINKNFSNNTWQQVRITSDAELKKIRVWIDNVEQTLTGSTANMGNWGTLSGTLYFGYLATTGRTLFLNEVQIWNQIIPGP